MFSNLIPKVLAQPAGVGKTEIIDLGVSGTAWEKLGSLKFNSLISVVITLLIAVVSLTFFFMLIMGGLKWISSGGDEKKLAAARGQITNALIGLVIVFSAWAIISLIQTVFGVNILQFKIPSA